MSYSIEFREEMVKRMVGPAAQSANSLSREVGVSVPTLTRWRRKACTIEGMPSKKPSKRVQDWTPSERLQAVIKTDGLSEEELGAYLRENGLHAKTLNLWRETMKQSLENTGESQELRETKRKNQELRRELNRKDKALAETTALLVLKKKVDLILGSEDEEPSFRKKKGR